MTPIGFVIINAFITVWIVSVAFAATALPLWVAGVTAPIKILVLYAFYRYFRPVRHWPEYHRLLSRLITDHPYFDAQKVVFESDEAIPVPDSSTLFAVFPHGAVCLGWTVNMSLNGVFQDAQVRYLGSSLLLKIPFIRDFLIWCSAGPASKSYVQAMMRQGRNLALSPGGYEEAALYRPGQYDVFVQERRGFVKYALQYGYRLSPVFSFGEEDTYSAVEGARAFRLGLARRQIPGIFFWSKLGIFPNGDARLVTVVGDPIVLPTIAAPSRQDVEKYHGEFVAALRSLFDKYKDAYAVDPKAILNVH